MHQFQAFSPQAPTVAEYAFPSVLQFLQSEWRRFERDRNEWDIERAEMKVKPFYYYYYPVWFKRVGWVVEKDGGKGWWKHAFFNKDGWLGGRSKGAGGYGEEGRGRKDREKK